MTDTQPATGVQAAKRDMIVHAVIDGNSQCGYPKGLTILWPPGQTWVVMEDKPDLTKITCKECIKKLAKEIPQPA